MLALASGPALAARDAAFSSPQAAFEHGMGALKAGRIETALPALEHAAGKGLFLAEFYLARVFADNLGPVTDHAKAYMLYQRIADENADIDPDYDQRAPFVAKAFTALAGYLRQGLPEIGLRPSPHRAAEYLHHAATFFNDPDAQFELAKLYLNGDDVPENAKQAMHWLSVLTEKGHAGAQAFLADLYWRGKHVPPDRRRALALITVALEHAPAHERIWIEDIHQNIFCGSTEDTRKDADGLVTSWRLKYGGRPAISIDRHGLTPLQFGAVRTCSNGEPVQASRSARSGISTSALRKQEPSAVMQGNTVGFGYRDAGQTQPVEEK